MTEHSAKEMPEEKLTKDSIVESLKQMICQNKLKSGDKLVEVALAKEFNTSRTPIREALRQLEAEGFVVSNPRKGVVVKELSKETILCIYDIRGCLEGLAARLACDNLPRKKIIRMSEILEDFGKAINENDNKRVFNLHAEWNKIIMDYCENPMLVNYLKQLTGNLDRLRSITINVKETQLCALEEHKKILKAFQDGDVNDADAQARNHIKNAKNRFLKNYEEIKA